MDPWKPIAYVRVGALYVLASLPGWVALVAGRLLEGRDPNLLLSLGGLPVGILFILFGVGRLTRNGKSEVAVRIGLIASSLIVFGVVSWLAMQGGWQGFEISVRFCTMAASYLSLIAVGFLVAALVTRKEAEAS